MVLRKHLSVLLSKKHKSNVLIPAHYFRESLNGWTVTRVSNNAFKEGQEEMEGQEGQEEVEGEEGVGGKVKEKSEDIEDVEHRDGATGTVVKKEKNNTTTYRTMSAFDLPHLKRPLIVDFRDDVLDWIDLEGLYPRYLPYDDHLSIDERRCWVDLRPYMNEAPPMISTHSVVTQAYQLFRHLGLRHLCVVDDDKDVIGLITRHELLPEKIIHSASEEQKDTFLWTPTPKHRLQRIMTAS